MPAGGRGGRLQLDRCILLRNRKCGLLCEAKRSASLPSCRRSRFKPAIARLCRGLRFSGAEIRCKIAPMKYGYARVSTDGQSIDAQVRQLKAADARQVFREVASGAKTNRAQLRRALAQLDAGDVLMVTRLDRLARSTRDLLNTLAAITGKGAGFRSLGDTWADTTTPHGRLMVTMLAGL